MKRVEGPPCCAVATHDVMGEEFAASTRSSRASLPKNRTLLAVIKNHEKARKLYSENISALKLPYPIAIGRRL